MDENKYIMEKYSVPRLCFFSDMIRTTLNFELKYNFERVKRKVTLILPEFYLAF